MDILQLLAKLVFKSISAFAKKAAWEGYFILAQEQNPDVNLETIKDIANYTYKKSAVKVLPFIKELLQNDGCSDGLIRAYLVSFINAVKDAHPLLYLLFETNNTSENLSNSIDNLDLLKKQIDEIQTSYIYKLNYFTVDQYENYLYQSSKDINNLPLSIKLFNFRDSSFTKSLEECLYKDDLIVINGSYQLETFLAVLFELKIIYKEDYNDKIYILTSREDYLSIQNASLPAGSVLINMFFDSGLIPFISGYKNIHIVSRWKTNDITLRLRSRLSSSTREAMKECGYSTDNIISLMRKCKNSFPHLYRALSNETDNFEEKIKSNISNKCISSALLVNRFSLSFSKDKEFISELSGYCIDDYVDLLMPTSLAESPFAKEIFNYQEAEIAVLDYERTFDTFYSDIKDSFANHFFDLAKQALCKLPKKYTEKYYIHSESEESYSDALITSIFQSLFLLSEKGKFKKQSSDLIDSFLKWIEDNNFNEYYEYFSDHLSILVEINPVLIMSKIELDIKEKKGLCSLFFETNRNNDFIFGKNWYTKVLWTLEKMLFLDIVRERAIKSLFELYRLEIHYNLSNSPKTSLQTFFLAWFKSTPVSEEEKTYYCEELFKIDSEAAWDIFVELLYSGGGETVSPFNGPTYIKIKPFSHEYKQKEIIERYRFYNRIVLNNTKNVCQIAKLIDKHSFVYFGADETEKVVSKLINVCKRKADKDKIIVLTAIRSFIHKNRKYATSSWAAPEEIVVKFEHTIKHISFHNPEAKFVSLFNDYDINDPNPLIYSKEEYNYSDLEKRNYNYLKKEAKRFSNNKYNVKYLCSYFNSNPNELKSHYHFYWFLKELVINLQRKSYVFLAEQINKDASNLLSLVSDLGRDLFNNDLDNYYIVSDVYVKSENIMATLEYLYSANINVNDARYLSLYDSLPKKIKIEYWKQFNAYINIDYSDSKNFTFVIKNIKASLPDGDSKNAFIDVVYYFSIHYHGSDLEELLYNALVDADVNILKNGHISYLPYILEKIQKKYAYINDFDIEFKIALLELLVIKYHGEFEPVCLKNCLGRDPAPYFSLLKEIYIDKETSSEKKSQIFGLLYFDIKFCPGYINGIFIEKVFEDWVNKFRSLISQTDFDKKDWLCYSTLGHLLKHASFEGEFPMPTKIMQFIESLSDVNFEEFKNSYCIEYHNSIGVRTISDGSDLFAKSHSLSDTSIKLKKNNYKKTSLIFDALSKQFAKSGEAERKQAENEW